MKVLFVAAVLVPLVGWGFGAMLNPTGWMSDSPLMVYYAFYVYGMYFWPITLGLGVLLTLGLLTARRRYYTAWVLFVLSFLYAWYIFISTRDANESEFTG
jgi:hypothetical protein